MKQISEHEKQADKYQIEGLKIITPYDVYNMLVSALEGGSNYWYWIGSKSDQNIKKATQDMVNEPYVDRFLMAIQRNVEVRIYDNETKERLGVLTPKSWAKAEKLILKNHRSHLGDLLKEQDDAITADVFFQLAVIGELTYG